MLLCSHTMSMHLKAAQTSYTANSGVNSSSVHCMLLTFQEHQHLSTNQNSTFIFKMDQCSHNHQQTVPITTPSSSHTRHTVIQTDKLPKRNMSTHARTHTAQTHPLIKQSTYKHQQTQTQTQCPVDSVWDLSHSLRTQTSGFASFPHEH